MYKKLNQAHKRPMTARERFGLLLFILQFLISKFGIFIVFLSFNVIGNTKIQNSKISPTNFAPQQSTTLSRLDFANSGEGPKLLGSSVSSSSLPQISKEKSVNFEPSNSTLQLHENLVGVSSTTLFSKLKIYCIIATIVTLFLNPQQTKYFGGLAVALKQAGLFSKYGKSEKTVYLFSWIFIVLFAQMSYSAAFLESTVGCPPRSFPIMLH
jgi:hypothetical protein